MRCEKSHVIRRGKPNDKGTGMSPDVPYYVLLCDGRQVGAMDSLDISFIAFFKIFKANRGVKHSEIFLEMLEEEAKRQGRQSMETVTGTYDPRMMRALEKCGFTVSREDSGEFFYSKRF